MDTVSQENYAIALKQMNGAIRTLEIYPPGHPASSEAIDKPFSALRQLFDSDDQLIISKVQERIVVNGKNVEGADFVNRWREEFERHNVSSLTFAKGLTKEEFSKFLSFFVKPLDKATQTVSLTDFIKNNDIQSITVDQLRYELVTGDEVVVKSQVVEGADLKAQISKIMKDNPDLLRDILLDKSVDKQSYAQRFGAQTDLSQLTEQVGKHIQTLSDDEVLGLLTSSLRQNLKKPASRDSSSELHEVVELADKLLQDRETTKLLPRVKKILAESGMVGEKQLDLLFEDKWLKSQEVLDELVRMTGELGSEKADSDRFKLLWQRVIASGDGQIKSYAIDKVLSHLDSENHEVRSQVVSALEQALGRFVKEKSESEFSSVRDKLVERLEDHSLDGGVLADLSQPLKIILHETVQRREFKEAQKILREYRARLGEEAACPDDVKKIARDFIREASDGPTLAVLMSQMREGVLSETVKSAERILESLDGEKVAQGLLNIFTSDDRAARTSALRVLSHLGKESLPALSTFLSNPRLFVRKEGGTLLVEEQWYKVRNVIYVLANIPDKESLKILSKLSGDPDKRVRREVIKALEKIDGPESVDALTAFLHDAENEVRRSAISAMTASADKRCLEPLKGHFRGNHPDRKITLTAIFEIGKQEATEFFLNVLRTDEGIEDLAPKEKDEIKITLLSILSKIASAGLADEIRKFVEQRGKGLISILVKDKVTEAATRAIKAIENKSRVRSRDDRKGRSVKTEGAG
jgi:HEAT repeat protein